jgi:hypothetical protein
MRFALAVAFALSLGALAACSSSQQNSPPPPPPPPATPAPPPVAPPPSTPYGPMRTCPGCGKKIVDQDVMKCPDCDTPLPAK